MNDLTQSLLFTQVCHRLGTEGGKDDAKCVLHPSQPHDVIHPSHGRIGASTGNDDNDDDGHTLCDLKVSTNFSKKYPME
jgi:hypothetical protein